jgi:hypothetical protein
MLLIEKNVIGSVWFHSQKCLRNGAAWLTSTGWPSKRIVAARDCNMRVFDSIHKSAYQVALLVWPLQAGLQRRIVAAGDFNFLAPFCLRLFSVLGSVPRVPLPTSCFVFSFAVEPSATDCARVLLVFLLNFWADLLLLFERCWRSRISTSLDFFWFGVRF